MDKWTVTVQKAVTAIRKAGARSQLILLPGKPGFIRFSASLLTNMQVQVRNIRVRETFTSTVRPT